MDHLAIAYHSHERTTPDKPLLHKATRHSAHFGNAEYFADLQQPGDILLALGCHHAGKCSLDLIHSFVNDAVIAHIHSGRVDELARDRIRTAVEANDN